MPFFRKSTKPEKLSLPQRPQSTKPSPQQQKDQLIGEVLQTLTEGNISNLWNYIQDNFVETFENESFHFINNKDGSLQIFNKRNQEGLKQAVQDSSPRYFKKDEDGNLVKFGERNSLGFSDSKENFARIFVEFLENVNFFKIGTIVKDFDGEREILVDPVIEIKKHIEQGFSYQRQPSQDAAMASAQVVSGEARQAPTTTFV